MAGVWIEARVRVPWVGRRGTEDARRRRIGSRGACELGVGRVLRGKGRKGATLLALPNASLAEKLRRDLETIEFGDAGHVSERVDRTMGMVCSWGNKVKSERSRLT